MENNQNKLPMMIEMIPMANNCKNKQQTLPQQSSTELNHHNHINSHDKGIN